MREGKLTSMMLPRRRFLQGAATIGGAAGLSSLGLSSAFAQEPEKPKELIVRAWGGSWVDALKAGVSDSFTAKTGIAVRHDLTEDNEIQPKVWAAVAQGRVPPIHINWDCLPPGSLSERCAEVLEGPARSQVQGPHRALQ
jgi:putative spermidine/putrescine transport system substrate-binding protein